MDCDKSPLRFNASRVLARSCESLLGICQGMLADNKLNEDEVLFLALWLRDNTEIASVWPGSVIAGRVESILSDGVITSDELVDFKDVLTSLVGGRLEQTGATGGLSTALPVDLNAAIEFGDRFFCFTGKFLYGPRSSCEAQVEKRGGYSLSAISGRLNYLVIGTLISPDWKYSTHGKKIEGAVDLRKKGGDLMIISEDQWIDALEKSGP